MPRHSSPDSPMTIGELARRTGCNIATIRFYESVGLLAATARRSNGYRVYDASTMRELGLVLALRSSGMGLKDIRAFVDARTNSTAPCSRISDLARQRAREIRNTIQHLRQQEERLRNFAESCTEKCQGQVARACSQLPF